MRIEDSARMNMEFQMIRFNENLTSWTAIPPGTNQLLTSKVIYSSNLLSNAIKTVILANVVPITILNMTVWDRPNAIAMPDIACFSNQKRSQAFN